MLKHCITRFSLCLILLGMVAAVPAFAGSAVVGSVAGSMNATVGGQTLLPNTTLFSGDNLQVRDGVAVVALGNASRMVFGRDTSASFLRDPNQVTVLLDQGNVSVFHDADGMPVRMKIGSVSIVPASGFKTLGEVAMLNGTVVVTAKDGMLQVDKGNGQVVNVMRGKPLTVAQVKAPPQGGGAGRCCSGSQVWGIAATVAGGAAAILAGVAMSRAGAARDNAASAESDAAAAASAAAAAAAAASAAVAGEESLGCALNLLANAEGLASPYTPPSGSCPAS